MVCRCACGGVCAGHIGSDHARTRSRPPATPTPGAKWGANRETDQILRPRADGAQDHKRSAQRPFPTPRERARHPGAGHQRQSEYAPAVDGQFAAAERHSTASSGRLRPATHRPAWRRPYARGMAPSGWRPEDHSQNDSRWVGGWLARDKRLNRPSRGPCTKCGVSAGRAPVNRPLTAPRAGRP